MYLCILHAEARREAEEMTILLLEYWLLFLSAPVRILAPTRQVSTVCISSPRKSNVFFWSYTHLYKHIHRQNTYT